MSSQFMSHSLKSKETVTCIKQQDLKIIKLFIASLLIL